MIKHSHNSGYKKHEGFALLMTLVVVTVLISIGLSVLQVSIVQIRLATSARDSEIAFHAANAGLECARYVRRQFSTEMEDVDPGLPNPEPISPACFGSNTNSAGDVITADVSGNGTVHQYEYEFTWGPVDSQRCSQINTVVMIADQPDLTMDSPRDTIPGYQSSNIVCAGDERCTVLSVQGYNKPCADIGSAGTIQREVLLEF